MPEHLKQGLCNWLKEINHGEVGEVSAVLFHATKVTHDVDSQASAKKSPLLSLPPEMRNRIYRFALVEEDDIEIPSGGPFPSDPPLLRTCSQIRGEAISIFYLENTFSFTIEDFNAGKYLEWCGTSKYRKESNHIFAVVDSTNWTNILRWLRASYQQEGYGFAPLEQDVGEEEQQSNTAAYLFDLAHEVEANGGTWEQVETALGQARKMLGVYDSEWLKKPDGQGG